MKWFKHEDTTSNPKVEMLTDKHGLIGYGFYFKMLELLSTNIKENNKEEWGFLPSEYTTEYLRRKFGVSTEVYQKLLRTCIELNLFQLIDNKIYCKQILDRGDDYLGRVAKTEAKKTPKKLRSRSVATTDIEEEVEREEEKEIDKKSITPLPPKITEQELQEISDRYMIPLNMIQLAQEEMDNWLSAKGKRYKDYKAGLRNWVLRDAKKAMEGRANGQSRVSIDVTKL